MPFADIEAAVKQWGIGNPRVAATVTHDGRTHVYQSMPAASPIPSLIIQRLGGAPIGRSELPVDAARLTFDCWGTTRGQALTIAQTLVTELDCLGSMGGYVLPDVTLTTAVVYSWTWLPDIRTDVARYVVDATIWALTTV
jgi:hypothetical protein